MSKSLIIPKKQRSTLKEEWKPRGYMKRGVEFLLGQAAGGLLLDPGMGKTSITLKAISVLLKAKLIKHILIIAPLRPCYLVWPKEIQRWKDFNHLRISILHGKDKEENAAQSSDIYIINPEGMAWLLSEGGRRFKTINPQMLVVDESSKYRKSNTQRFKLLKTILPQFDRRVILTGSPSPRSLMDLFGQIYILDQGNVLGRYITEYRRNYFSPHGYGGFSYKLQPGADKKIYKAIKPLCLRLDAEDHLDMPKLVINDIIIELDKKSRKIYDEMEKLMITTVSKRDVFALHAATATLKCCQIANGGVYDEKKKAHTIHMLKAEAVADLVEELEGVPALVSYEFGHDLDRLKLVLGKQTPDIGRASMKDSAQIEADWNKGKIPCMLGNPMSIGHGLNLQFAGNHLIMPSLIWDYEYYDQWIRRLRRSGAKHSTIFLHRIVAKDTIDEAKIAALGRKAKTQKQLFEALKDYIAKKTKG